jgi:hypothetical protein
MAWSIRALALFVSGNLLGQIKRGFLRWRAAAGLGLAMERHNLNGDKERQFSPVLTDMDLYYSPCKSLAANQVFCAGQPRL